MTDDYSWTHSAREYLKLYQKLPVKKETKTEKLPEEPNPVVVDI